MANSYFTAGMACCLVAAGVGAAPVAPAAPAVASPAVRLAVAESPGDWIINAYNTVQPWVEYGVELFAWAVEWLPWPIGLLAPQADIVYGGWQPFAQSVVYSLAYLVDGRFDLIIPTLTLGVQTGVSNLIQGEIAWIASFFPPLPPIGSAQTTRAANSGSTLSRDQRGAEAPLPRDQRGAGAPRAARSADRTDIRVQRHRPAARSAADRSPGGRGTAARHTRIGTATDPAPSSAEQSRSRRPAGSRTGP